jgi:hypothetical protein
MNKIDGNINVFQEKQILCNCDVWQPHHDLFYQDGDGIFMRNHPQASLEDATHRGICLNRFLHFPPLAD